MALKNTSFKSIATLQNCCVHQLQLNLNTQLQLTQHVKTALPNALAKHVLHCVLDNNRLILYTSSASWASQLRFYNRIITDAVSHGAGVTNITLQIKIITLPNNQPESSLRRVITPSAKAIEHLRVFSNTVQDDQLKTALLKLTNTLTRLASQK